MVELRMSHSLTLLDTPSRDHFVTFLGCIADPCWSCDSNGSLLSSEENGTDNNYIFGEGFACQEALAGIDGDVSAQYQHCVSLMA